MFVQVDDVLGAFSINVFEGDTRSKTDADQRVMMGISLPMADSGGFSFIVAWFSLLKNAACIIGLAA